MWQKPTLACSVIIFYLTILDVFGSKALLAASISALHPAAGWGHPMAAPTSCFESGPLAEPGAHCCPRPVGEPRGPTCLCLLVLRPRLITTRAGFFISVRSGPHTFGASALPTEPSCLLPHLTRSPKALLMTEISDRSLRKTGQLQTVWKALGNFLDDEETDTLYLFIFLCCSAGD